MTSHIPLALSILGTLASHSLGSLTQKAAPPPPPPPAAPPSVAPSGPAPSINGASSAPASAPSASANATNTASTGTTNAPANGAVALCDVCQLRPKYFDGNKTHPYCSKTCANKKLNGVGNTSGSQNCSFCHNRPKHNDGTKTHDFCSKACAKNALPQRKGTGSGWTAAGLSSSSQSISMNPVAHQQNNTNTATSTTAASTTTTASTTAVCQAPGCTNPPHMGHDYCSLAHKTLGETLCLMCLQEPKMPNSHFCSQACTDDAESKGPMILEVPVGHVTFKSVADQFKTSWRHVGTICPPVRRVYKILVPPASLSAYNAYRAAVEAQGQFLSSGRSEGNENRRWHGTRRVCNLGDKGQTQFCSASNCSLCCIIRTSYDISLWGKKTGWGRFGKGIYTSSTSSKSNDYSSNDCKSNLKAILLNKVVVGKGCKMIQDNTSLTAPPLGYDSVLAEKGGSLNYDELVVYSNDAIRPSFLVMYEP
ncbi:ADP-ribosylation [Agrocybe pediades]|nr:ADP-ribosylation [Agrocybe pediades]